MSKVVPLLETIFINKGGSSKLWKTTNEILLQKSDEAKHFCTYMKNKLRTINQETQLLALDFLDYSIDDGKMPLWTQVSSKDFLGTLVNLLKTRDAPEVSTKILYLISKWGKKFEKYHSIIPNFTDTYRHLKNSGINFPEGITSTYSQYIMSGDDLNEYNQNSVYNNNNNNFNDEGNYNMQRNNPYIDTVCLNLKPSKYKSKYKKLVEKLNEWTYNIAQINQIVDTLVPGRANKHCEELVENIRKGNRQLVETIQSDKLKDEELMEIALKVNEDIKNTINRYEQVKKKINVEPFVSVFANQEIRVKNKTPQFDVVKKQREEQNSQQSQTHANLLDIFGSSSNSNNNNNAQQNQQQNQIGNNSNVNDLFDIFGSGNNNNNQPNIGMNMNTNMLNVGYNNNNNNNNAMNFMNSNNNNSGNSNNNLMDFTFMTNNNNQTNLNPNLMPGNYNNNNNNTNNNNNNNMIDFNLMSNQNINSNVFPNTNMNSNQNIFGGIDMPSFDQSNTISPKTDMLAQRINLAYNDPKQFPTQMNIPQKPQNNNNFLNMNANTITTTVGASTLMANNNYNFAFNNNNNNTNVNQHYPPQQMQNQFQNNNFNYNNNNPLNSLF